MLLHQWLAEIDTPTAQKIHWTFNQEVMLQAWEWHAEQTVEADKLGRRVGATKRRLHGAIEEARQKAPDASDWPARASWTSLARIADNAALGLHTTHESAAEVLLRPMVAGGWRRS